MVLAGTSEVDVPQTTTLIWFPDCQWLSVLSSCWAQRSALSCLQINSNLLLTQVYWNCHDVDGVIITGGDSDIDVT